MYGDDPGRMPYRMMVVGRRLRPFCDDCYESYHKEKRNVRGNTAPPTRSSDRD